MTDPCRSLLIFVEPEALGCLPDLPVVFGRGLLCGFDTLALSSQVLAGPLVELPHDQLERLEVVAL